MSKYIALGAALISISLIVNERFNKWFSNIPQEFKREYYFYGLAFTLLCISLLIINKDFLKKIRRSKENKPVFFLYTIFFSLLICGLALYLTNYKDYITLSIIFFALISALFSFVYILIAGYGNTPESWIQKENLEDDNIPLDELYGDFDNVAKNIHHQITTESKIIENNKDWAKFQSYAILGAWGSGKTLLWELVEKYLHEGYHEHDTHVPSCEVNTHLIHINPWKIKSDEPNYALALTFLKSMAEDVDNKFYIPFFKIKSKIFISQVIPNFRIGAKSTIAQSVFEFFFKSSICPYELMQTAIQDIQQKVIIVVDDIDRLTHKEIVMLLGLVRSTLHFKNVSIVCCMDKEKCVTALRNEKLEETYLQKIFTKEFQVPQIEYFDLRSFILESICKNSNFSSKTQKWKISADYNQNLRNVQEMLNQPFSEVLISNMRHAKKLINAFKTYKPILFSEADSNSHMYEINLADWLCLEMISMNDSHAYSVLNESCDRRYEDIEKNADTNHLKSLISASNLENTHGAFANLLKRDNIELSPSIREAYKYLVSKNKYSESNDYAFSIYQYRGNYFKFRKDRGLPLEKPLTDAINKLSIKNWKNLARLLTPASRKADFSKVLIIIFKDNRKASSSCQALLESMKHSNFNRHYRQHALLEITKQAEKLPKDISTWAYPITQPTKPSSAFIHAIYAIKIIDINKFESENLIRLAEKILGSNLPWFSELEEQVQKSTLGLNENAGYESFEIARFIAHCISKNSTSKARKVYVQISNEMLNLIKKDKSLVLYFLSPLRNEGDRGNKRFNIINESGSAEVQKLAIDLISQSFKKGFEISSSQKNLELGYTTIYSENNNTHSEFQKKYFCDAQVYALFLQEAHKGKLYSPIEIDLLEKFISITTNPDTNDSITSWLNKTKNHTEDSRLLQLLCSIYHNYLMKELEAIESIKSKLTTTHKNISILDEDIKSYLNKHPAVDFVMKEALITYREAFNRPNKKSISAFTECLEKMNDLVSNEIQDKMRNCIKIIENNAKSNVILSEKYKVINEDLSWLFKLINSFVKSYS